MNRAMFVNVIKPNADFRIIVKYEILVTGVLSFVSYTQDTPSMNTNLKRLSGTSLLLVLFIVIDF